MTWPQRVSVTVWLALMGWLAVASWSQWTPIGLVVLAGVAVLGAVVVAGVWEANTTAGVDDWSAMRDREKASAALVAANGGNPAEGENR